MREQEQGASDTSDRACALRVEPQASQAEPLVPSADALAVAREDYARVLERDNDPWLAKLVRAGKCDNSQNIAIRLSAVELDRSRAEWWRSIPDDIAQAVMAIGEAEWGQTPAHDANGHADHIRESVQMTAEHFGQTDAQHMHGLFIKGAGTVICHTGTSPNSPIHARALTGAWNFLLEGAAQAIEARSGETGTGSTEGESAMATPCAPNSLPASEKSS